MRKALRNDLKVIGLFAYTSECPRVLLLAAFVSRGLFSTSYLDLHRLVEDVQYSCDSRASGAVKTDSAYRNSAV